MEIKTGLMIQSSAFKDGERIPDRYTCNGKNASPPLSWEKGDIDVKSWTLIVDDPDAPSKVFTHWLLYNIPAETIILPEGLPTLGELQDGARQGKNDTMKTGYTGPCPPPGPVHHYNFTLYALDSVLDLPAGVNKKQLLEAMRTHVVSQSTLIGTYQSVRSR